MYIREACSMLYWLLSVDQWWCKGREVLCIIGSQPLKTYEPCWPAPVMLEVPHSWGKMLEEECFIAIKGTFCNFISSHFHGQI